MITNESTTLTEDLATIEIALTSSSSPKGTAATNIPTAPGE